jgi:hypothetical protein
MKKSKNIILDVDFIGNQDNPLTDKERKEISDYLKSKKEKTNLKSTKKRTIKTQKAIL